ncbi:hypothetical protein PGT21_006263 [Puccinia graminis f. sp. tritici]|uniref:RING-type domain-containing protein n=1 Tax=Puccinia graminis f. sp. tritici TaxID=56615 RepID=A0A5B0LJU4_PUCGR|nr:hypothetical protein PGTUg99_004753 [Puccinia graminis f. sp. tritici]KAA1064519.1 hypothetical protein PGT21_006263 [Puccinia graminis f. sp. tritici]
MYPNGFAARSSLFAMGMLLLMMRQVSAPSSFPDLLMGPAVGSGSKYAIESVIHKMNCQSTHSSTEYKVISSQNPCKTCSNKEVDRHVIVICNHCLNWAPIKTPLCDSCTETIKKLAEHAIGYM